MSHSPWWIDAIVDLLPAREVDTHIRDPQTSTTVGVTLASHVLGSQSQTNVSIGTDLQHALDRIAQDDPQFSKLRFMRWATAAYLRDLQRRKPKSASLQKSYILTIMTSESNGRGRRRPSLRRAPSARTATHRSMPVTARADFAALHFRTNKVRGFSSESIRLLSRFSVRPNACACGGT